MKRGSTMQNSFDATATLNNLVAVVGQRHVLTDDHDTHLYRQGRRYGSGEVFAVVTPGSLLEQWQVLQIAVAADCIVIMQAANTGLTGGSTPFGEYDRPVIVMSTRRLAGIQVIQEGKQVVCCRVQHLMHWKSSWHHLTVNRIR